ncbi:MAG: hypothetical protein HZB51_05110 [Chloroflexi bacterium]|nr:hypothetical protein [Chloroflexota bacterium]
MSDSNLLPHPRSHDLRLPSWGPYTKKYAGVAHIADPAQGIRFDLSVFPAYYRSRVTVPHSQWESGYHPWQVSPGLSFFSYRFDLEWKDQVYCDVSYFALPENSDANARWVRCEFVNHTDVPQNLALHYMAYLNFPPLKPYSEEAILPADPHLPPGANWIDALDYADLQYATARPSDNLVYEGWRRGEIRGHGFVHGTGIGCDFGKSAGDRLTYEIAIPQRLEDGLLLARYRANGGPVDFQLRGLVNDRVCFDSAVEFRLRAIPLGARAADTYRFELISLGGGAIELDGFVLIEKRDRERVQFSQHEWNPVAKVQAGPRENSLLVNYQDLSSVYGLVWTGESSVVRQIFSGELDRTLRYFTNEHVQTELHSDDRGHFTNVFIRPISLEPHSKSILHGLVCNGSSEQVNQQLLAFDAPSIEAEYARAQQTQIAIDANPAGEKYRFSQERMAATLMTNVVYPVYTRGNFIRHFTPGKWWDCLYTWDSGFISLGLLGIDPARGIDCLNAYTTPVGDPHAAFIHHGSPVPVQIYAFQELWNRTRSRELLEYFYPRLRQFYLFIAGRLGSSTTRRMKSNLLKTWDYFYNSGGWDDLPPQVETHKRHLESTVTPVVTTAHAIRVAKILQQAARELGLDNHGADYQSDIDVWHDALNRYAWDGLDKIFSYVIHDQTDNPDGILRNSEGHNLNRTLDGVTPFFAGICNSSQERALYHQIESAEHLWTPVGLTAVDQSAPYYRRDGYWNGAVWFPYQWFIWKALLDLGYGDMAFRIAHTALEIWQDEVAASYHCFEHFIVESRRGAGWHQFGGLSTPVLLWFNAYHTPGTLTCGFDTWIQDLQVSDDKSSLQATLIHDSNPRPWLAVAVLSPAQKYSVEWNGDPIDYQTRYPGTLEIALTGSGKLTITAQSF